MNGYLIALAVFILWIALVYALNKIKWFERHNMSLMGPMVMWKTRRGREFIDRLSRRRKFWINYGRAALWICAGAMFTIMALLLWEATIVSLVEEPPAPELILGIPGLNPVIPIGYGIFGLVIAIVVHEFAHGVLTRTADIKVQSMGVVFLVFPVGAFVEPDEKELQATTRRKRSRVFAAGPASNLILAMMVLGLFSGVMMSSLEPDHEGALALGVVGDSPIARAGVVPNSLLVSVAGISISSASDLETLTSVEPGDKVSVVYYYRDRLQSANEVVYGVVVAFVAEGFAAHGAGLRPSMVLISLNDTPISNAATLSEVMAECRAGQTVNISVMVYDEGTQQFVTDTSITEVVLSDKWDYYEIYNPSANRDEYKGVAWLGGGFLDLGVRAADSSYYADFLGNPFGGVDDFSGFSRSWLRLIALPFLDLAPVRSPVTDLYHPSGSLEWMPEPAFWLVANALYWVFWLNLMLGLTNVLPAVPLDGGYIFRDGVDYVLSRVRKSFTKEQRDSIVGPISVGLALLVLMLILWQLAGPAILN
jgi:membrane-associated protease RseP (regulator of RpoE activity)